VGVQLVSAAWQQVRKALVEEIEEILFLLSSSLGKRRWSDYEQKNCDGTEKVIVMGAATDVQCNTEHGTNEDEQQ
jgi:hypothetical protein